jgi:hypothetical protein
MDKWYPGKKPDRFELLEMENARLKAELARCQKRLLEYSWQVNPDRSGGQFDYRDYEQLERGRQGIFG